MNKRSRGAGRSCAAALPPSSSAGRRQRLLLAVLALIAVAAGLTALVQAPAAAPGALTALLPAGPLMVVQSPEFAALLNDWDAAPEKRAWLASDNYAVFSRSRLFLRLKDARDEFAAAAGFSPGLPLVRSVAGSEAALALYDIGKLEFLYVTRLDQPALAQVEPWKNRAKFEPRQAAGLDYYVVTSKDPARTVALAWAQGTLFLATREDLLSGALLLLAGKNRGGLAAESWYDRATKAAGSPGILRIALNLPPLLESPYFRSYWIQRNVSDLKGFASFISDIHRSADGYREERVMLRAAAAEQPAPARAGLAAVTRVAPADAGLYRAWASPSVDDAIRLIARKTLLPRQGAARPSESAPSVALTGGEAGSERDLEVLIDEPPLPAPSHAVETAALRKVFETAGIQAMLHVESSAPVENSAFVRSRAVIALLGASDWDSRAAGAALVSAAGHLWSASRAGTSWVERQAGQEAYYELDGLQPLAYAAQGRWLLIGNDAPLLAAVLTRTRNTAAPPGPAAAPNTVYAAGFRHALESARYMALMRPLDRVSHPGMEQAISEAAPAPADGGPAAQPRREPYFFSENIGSLSRTLRRIESETIVTRDEGAALKDTVVYRIQ